MPHSTAYVLGAPSNGRKTMAAKKTTAKKSAKKTTTTKESKPRESWQRSVAHVVEAALEDAGGRGTTVAAIAAKAGLPDAKIQRHLDYMCNELDGYKLKNVRASHTKAGVYKLNSVGHFQGDNALDLARERFEKKPARKRSAKK